MRLRVSRTQKMSSDKIKVAISSCLLGQEVRFDGGHKRDAYINGTLSQYFEFVPVCPEVAIGLGTPREPIRLIEDPQRPRVVGVRHPELDVTQALEAYGHQMAGELTDLCGYILKRASPSCGMERVKVYSSEGMPLHNKARGVYARVFMERQPLLPIEEEGRLGDPVLRENFIQRVFVYHRWQSLLDSGLTPGKLVDFHARHKLIVMAHSQAAAKRLGQLVAAAGHTPLKELQEQYIDDLMVALSRKVGRKNHANVLMHLMGFLKRAIDSADKSELLETIDAYRMGQVPLVVPLTLLKHHFRRHPDPYVQGQHYLDPHPKELMLRNAL
jgi:uncharacterized protein YbgA (DUF1722 family)/uncharacterized protein YbbK (DUF523 family)